MQPRDILDELREIVEELKANGQQAIQCDDLLTFLAEVDEDESPRMTDAELERYKSQLQNHSIHYRYENEGSLEMFRSVIASGQGFLKASFVLNGGAALALLAFIGHLAAVDPDSIAEFVFSLSVFAGAVFAVASNYGVTYLSQWLYAGKKDWMQKVGFGFNIAAIVLGATSVLLFGWGMFEARNAFKGAF